MKLSKSIELPSGTVIPVGTELSFDGVGNGEYNGEAISIYGIPTHAIEMAKPAVEANQIISTENSIEFDEVRKGDVGYDVNGNAITILDKAVGVAGLVSLAKDYSIKEFEAINIENLDELAAHITAEDKFVVIRTSDDTIELSRYSRDYAVALESTNIVVKPFKDIKQFDTVSIDNQYYEVIAKSDSIETAKSWIKAHGISENDDMLTVADGKPKTLELLLVRSVNGEGLRILRYEDIQTSADMISYDIVTEA